MKRLCIALVVAWAGSASAYPWMVKHNYTSCSTCHVDPSGAGQLTTFGRMESERLLRWYPHASPANGVGSPRAGWLWFAQLPDWLNLSGNLRFGGLVQPGRQPVAVPLEMAADLSATVTVAQRLVLHVTGGFGRRDVIAPAALLPACDPLAPGECGPSLVTRSFWAGVPLAEGAVMLRGGRLQVPFGLRNNEHDTWVRALTRTDTNVGQQLGAAASYSSGADRFEVMGLMGGFSPDTREAGYSALLEHAFRPTLTLGLSSLVAASTGPQSSVTRHAHGAFVRWAPVTPVVLLAEADVLAWKDSGDARVGYAALAQADWEVMQGLHLMLSAESAHRGVIQAGPSLGAWASVAWYFYSHFELRLDNVVRRYDVNAPLTYMLVAQLHFYL